MPTEAEIERAAHVVIDNKAATQRAPLNAASIGCRVMAKSKPRRYGEASGGPSAPCWLQPTEVPPLVDGTANSRATLVKLDPLQRG